MKINIEILDGPGDALILLETERFPLLYFSKGGMHRNRIAPWNQHEITEGGLQLTKNRIKEEQYE